MWNLGSAVQRDDNFGFVLLRLPDGEGDIYDVEHLSSGIMINQASGGPRSTTWSTWRDAPT